jgi:hypothetical protein
MDLSPIVAWFFPLVGVLASVYFGVRRGNSGSRSVWAVGLLLALVLGVGLTFVQVLDHSLCMGTAQLCTSRGDVNMSYWFQSFFCVPLYWAAAIGGWRMTR